MTWQKTYSAERAYAPPLSIIATLRLGALDCLSDSDSISAPRGSHQSSEVQHHKITATALVTRNSISYIQNVFALNASSKTFVNVPNEAFAKSLTGISIRDCVVPHEGTGWFKEHHPLIRGDRPAQVTYTSGTEGEPKGIVLTYSNLADTVERITQQMELNAEIREYVGVPVTFSFGIARIRSISAVGGHSFLPSRGFDPLEFTRMLKAGQVNSLSAVPTLLRILLQNPRIIGEAGRNLRWLEIGSQYMTGAEKRAVRDLFPNARIVQHYGLTEASRSTFLQISEESEKLLESVGKPVGASEVAVSPQGRILIRGPHVARWRLEGENLVDLCDEDGWLQTSDEGHIEQGYLYYDGRADDVINSGGIKINPDWLEAAVGSRLNLGGKVVVARVPDALRGDGILVAAESTDLSPERLRSSAADALKDIGIDAGDALHVRIVSEIPRTATGKALRRRISKEYLEQEGANLGPLEGQADAPTANDVKAFFQRFFPGQAIRPQDSFRTMGGDSLSYIRFSLAYEDRFGPLPKGWESLTTAELERQAAVSPKSFWRQLESATLTRAFFMVCIVALHLDTFVYSPNWGAAYFLFMLAGYSVMRFQWLEISRTGKIDTIVATVARVAIPTIMVIVAMQLWARNFELKPLLLISNWFDSREYQVAYYYFAEIYMQLLLVVGGLLLIPMARTWLEHRPMTTCVALIALAMAGSWLVDQVWDTNYLYHRTPIWYLWTVALGMLIASVRDLKTRTIAMAIAIVTVVMHHGFTSASGYILGASALLLFWPEITVPAGLKLVVSEIAGSSMFMYLSHFQVKSLVTKVFHGPVPWLALLVAIGFGIVFGRIYNWLEGKARALLRRHAGAAIAAWKVQTDRRSRPVP